MAQTGTAIIDFGAASAKNTLAFVDVTGQTGILSNSFVEAWLSPVASTDHTADEHLAESFKPVLAAVTVPGSTFRAWLNCFLGTTYGKWNINWVWK